MPNVWDKILEEEGIKYEDLNTTERETYNQSIFNVQTIGIGDLKDKLQDLIYSIALQVSNHQVITDADKRKDDLLKGRLQNYLLLAAFLAAPEKAEKAAREAIKNRKK